MSIHYLDDRIHQTSAPADYLNDLRRVSYVSNGTRTGDTAADWLFTALRGAYGELSDPRAAAVLTQMIARCEAEIEKVRQQTVRRWG